MMTEMMFGLRRSARTLLERDGYPGPGPGRLGLVMARAGVGKTAFLVGIGLDALLAGQNVLHISLQSSVDKARSWYDDLLTELLRRERKLEHKAEIQLAIERQRHIHTYVGRAFTPERLRQAVELLRDVVGFVPGVIIFDQPDLASVERSTVEALRSTAAELGAELWMACRTHRDGPQAAPGHLPPPADRVEDLVDLAFRLDAQKSKVRLRVVKDREHVLDHDLNVVLDPETLLLVTGVTPRR
ncbi:MAG: hypothetical protein KA072_10435 [Thermoanaerobaculaceae bacterium]|nr:hypothetical protein [Thermoanaerobaculaceae bacterium]MDI9620985.1 hypothetical protein [Acidobacteriota bacterium]NLH11996.1 hypothetical protein [Holophagae bacterium]HPW56364.1 hypothetical protein [Thermoanaerobaculaceae bacterium]